MTAFFIIYFVCLFTAPLWFFHFGGSHYELLKPGARALNWSKEGQERLKIFFRWFFRILAIGVVVAIIVPMSMDIPYLLKEDFMVASGYPQHVNRNHRTGRQSVRFEDVTVTMWFYSRLSTEKDYDVMYLPHSKMAVEVIEYTD